MIQLISAIINANFPTELEKHAPHSNTVSQVKEYIDAENGMTMSLNDFAKYFFQSKFYLDKKFKKEFGVSLIEYRNIKRMELANQLLQNNSVTQTAEKLGYQSVYSFSRAYKNFFGFSPSQYKK